jgi:hypothetical protein
MRTAAGSTRRTRAKRHAIEGMFAGMPASIGVPPRRSAEERKSPSGGSAKPLDSGRSSHFLAEHVASTPASGASRTNSPARSAWRSPSRASASQSTSAGCPGWAAASGPPFPSPRSCYEGDGLCALCFGDRSGKWTEYFDLERRQTIDAIIAETRGGSHLRLLNGMELTGGRMSQRPAQACDAAQSPLSGPLVANLGTPLLWPILCRSSAEGMQTYGRHSAVS